MEKYLQVFKCRRSCRRDPRREPREHAPYSARKTGKFTRNYGKEKTSPTATENLFIRMQFEVEFKCPEQISDRDEVTKAEETAGD